MAACPSGHHTKAAAALLRLSSAYDVSVPFYFAQGVETRIGAQPCQQPEPKRGQSAERPLQPVECAVRTAQHGIRAADIIVTQMVVRRDDDGAFGPFLAARRLAEHRQ